MGYGDKLMAIGDAWVLHQADPFKRKVAIGDGRTLAGDNLDLVWGLDHFLATQEEADGNDVEWVYSYPGHRPYIDYEAMKHACAVRGIYVNKPKKLVSRLGRYLYNLNYHAEPAPIRFTPEEEDIAGEFQARGPAVIIEPYIKANAPPSKQYPIDRFHEIARRLQREVPVYQIGAPDSRPLTGLPQIRGKNFRQAMAYLKGAALYIGPEGGLHHASAATRTPAVVIYGGFTSPIITGYPDIHVNLTGGAMEACGTRFGMCPHCTTAFANITPTLVASHAKRLLAGEKP
jgi:ADP-heptose:LPS heptosyltransferase